MAFANWQNSKKVDFHFFTWVFIILEGECVYLDPHSTIRKAETLIYFLKEIDLIHNRNSIFNSLIGIYNKNKFFF